MFFFLVGFGLGIYLAQEHPELPNMKHLFRTASKALQDAIRGGENDFDAEKSD
jgi:hypothetical protein